ncbi:aminoglycoside adenylyltransferase domain-containing protein [Streptomyces sp. GC420]|uniref:aminoglycoside adenylyltransferase domain-containing protein n=1 Tax=Streptomyces sp. GC420 TaxID=2697568 RepID=UPI0014150F7E|nr:aminoglycoside adenylyltransferase domain-containing protein [Streptomyces sp. GC420]NBM16252.1 DUF4111 domain-containing protein [Streptomyces sp. GC420]
MDRASGTPPSGEPSFPEEPARYLAELARRVEAVCGAGLVTVSAVGSVALGDYRPGRSDLDVLVVVDERVPGSRVRELPGELRHPGLFCPAAGLELVVYSSEFAAVPSARAGYLLDLNTGSMLPERTSFDPAGSAAFWYVIDRSVAHQSGLRLLGRDPREVVAAPSRQDLLDAVAASLEEHAAGAGHLQDNRVLNACRSLTYLRTRRWVSKPAAAAAVLPSAGAFAPLVSAAVRSHAGPRRSAAELPAAEVRAFLNGVREQVEGEQGER